MTQLKPEILGVFLKVINVFQGFENAIQITESWITDEGW